jgi:hypothetical protein
MNATIIIPFLSQKTNAIRIVVGRTLLFKPFVSVCVTEYVYASTALAASCSQHSQMKPGFHHLLLYDVAEKSIAILVVSLWKSHSHSHFLDYVRNREHFRNSS